MGKLGLNSGYIGSDQRITTNGVVGYDKFYLERKAGRFFPVVGIFNPIGFIPNLYAYWDASFNVSQVNTSVSSWVDRTETFTLVSANNPTYTATINGFPTITFDGTDDYMRTQTTNFSIGTNYTWFSVVRFKNTSNTVPIAFQPANVIVYSFTNTTFQTFDGNGGLTHGNYTPDQPGLLMSKNESGGAFISRYNGNQLNKGAGNSINNSDVILGAYQAGGGFIANFDIAELVIFNRTLNSDEIQSIEDYLINRYGLIY
jgi:hypothetical protein